MESPMMNAAARGREADEELEEPLTPSNDVASSSWLARVRAGKPYSAGWFALVFGLPITMAWGLLWLLLIALYALVSAQNNVPNDPYTRIDCGGFEDFTNNVNQTWKADDFFTGGAPASVLEPDRFAQKQERTLRFFPVTLGKKNCYVIQVPNGRYYIRMFFVYDNYDRQQHSPSFDVAVEGTVVFSWRAPWRPEIASSGAYSDLYSFIQDGAATICFYSIGTDTPLIGALELLQVDSLSYDAQTTGQNVILVNYGRIAANVEAFGPGYSNDTDQAGRGWDKDDAYSSTPKSVITTSENIRNTLVPPNYYPPKLYQTARVLPNTGDINFEFQVDPSLDYALWLHFAEIDPNVKAPGQRVFDVSINDQIVLPGLDIFGVAGGAFAAYDWHHTAKNLTGSTVSVALLRKIGTPTICGLELYALLPSDFATNATEAMAMQELKLALRVPQRMGWNGDPCAPTRWDAWEGVTCNFAADNSGLVVSHIEVAGQGLQGSISEKVTLLSHLISLNASNNLIEGSIPEGLGRNSLTNLDLSGNRLSGSIPASLGSARLQQVLLNANQLSGQVPVEVYSIGVLGGFINLSSNAGLCGVPSMPACPSSWKVGWSLGGKIGVILGAVVAVALVLVLLYMYKKRHQSQEDYNFNLPHQLAARTKWYQNYKANAWEAEDEYIMRQNSTRKFGFSSNIAPL